MEKGIIIIITLAVYGIAALCVAAVMLIRKKQNSMSEGQDFIDRFLDRKRQEIEGGGSGISFKNYCIMAVGLPTGVFLLSTFLMDDLFGPAILAVVCLFLPNFITKLMAKRRQSQFEERYSRALKTLASDLKSGMSIQQAVEDISTNKFVNPDIREGFSQVSSDIKTGIPVEEAFARYAQEYDTPDTRDVAASITMLSEVGGSEAKMIELVSENIRDRVMLRKEIKTLFADTEMMATIMDMLPFLVTAILYLAARDLIQPFFESTGMTILFVGIMAFTLAGSYFIRKKLRTAKKGDL